MNPDPKNKVTFRKAERNDAALILYFIRQIAEYENLQHEVIATEELINKWIFDKQAAHVIFAEINGKPIGFAVYFFNYSTFTGRAGLYLEDLFLLPEYRNNGYGKALLYHLAAEAYETGCGRMEWVCLDWNENSIKFYKSIGAEPMDEWTIYRLSRSNLKKIYSETCGNK